MPDQTQALIRLEDAALILGFDTSKNWRPAFHRFLKRSRLPIVRVSQRRLRISPDAIDAYIASRTVGRVAKATTVSGFVTSATGGRVSAECNEVPVRPVFVTNQLTAKRVAAESGAVHSIIAAPTVASTAVAPYLDGFVLVARFPNGDWFALLHHDRDYLKRAAADDDWLTKFQNLCQTRGGAA